jgi:hypothetical protein
LDHSQAGIKRTDGGRTQEAFAHKLSQALSGDHDLAKVDMVDRLNRQLRGWAAFYKYTDFTATTFRHIDHVVFWKMAHWLGGCPKGCVSRFL